eukprot:7427899-Pyramimonas_sp.AAC.1
MLAVAADHAKHAATDSTRRSCSGPIGRRKHEYILTMDQSDAGSVGIFSRWTKQTPGSARR